MRDIHSPRERSVFEISCCQAELSIYCEITQGGCGCFTAVILDAEGKTAACLSGRPQERMTVCLPPGCYTVRVCGSANLSPGRITKWIELEPCARCGLCFLFSSSLPI